MTTQTDKIENETKVNTGTFYSLKQNNSIIFNENINTQLSVKNTEEKQ